MFPKLKSIQIKKWLIQRVEVEMIGILKFTIETLFMQLKKDKSDQQC